MFLSSQGLDALFVRSGFAFLTALISSVILIHLWILGCKRYGIGQPIRDVIPEHRHKANTPTMGGVPLVGAVMGSTFLWGDLTNAYVSVLLLVFGSCGAIGLIDDTLKILRNSGIRPKHKLLAQVGVGGVGCSALILVMPEFGAWVVIPFVGIVSLAEWAFIPLAAFFCVAGFSNAVNLTDGLDGLAIVPIMIAALCLGVIALLIADDLHRDFWPFYDPAVEETVLLAASILGSGIGFLWFNAPPARVFMGDSGALALGGLLGAWSVAVKHELFFVIIGGVFVLEAMSVILQVIWVQGRKKRLFRKSPIHHHFHLSGWSETTIVIRFWILSALFALSGLLLIFLSHFFLFLR